MLPFARSSSRRLRNRRFGCSPLVNEAAADQLAVDLVGALPDLSDLGVAHQPLDPVVLAIAVATVELHGFGRDSHRQVRGAHLEHRGLDCEIVGPAVDKVRDVPQPRLAQSELGGEVGEHELDALELHDPPARLPALVDIGDRILEGGAGDPERVGGDTRPRLVERGEQQLQPGPRLAEQVGARYDAPGKRVRRSTRRGAPFGPPCGAP